MSTPIENIGNSGGNDVLMKSLYISPADKMVLKLAEAGKTVEEIAEELKVSARAVQVKINLLYQRMQNPENPFK